MKNILKHWLCRKGQIGDWKNYFSGDKLAEWDNWIQQNLEGTNIKMVFE